VTVGSLRVREEIVQTMGKSKFELCHTVFKQVTRHFPEQWICDEKWFQFITGHTPELLNLNVTRANIVRATGIKSPPGIGNFVQGTNESGIFMKTSKMNCPINKNRRQVYFYYVTEPGNYAAMPQQSGDDFVRNNPQHHNLTGEGGDGPRDEDAQDEKDGRDEDAQDENDGRDEVGDTLIFVFRPGGQVHFG
jgi:hypothetical protein